MMTVYVIGIKRGGCYYVGITKRDISLRLEEHNCGNVTATRKISNNHTWYLVHSWQAPNYILASKLERFCHMEQRWRGDKAILQLIDKMPSYTHNWQQLINSEVPTTSYEANYTIV